MLILAVNVLSYPQLRRIRRIGSARAGLSDQSLYEVEKEDGQSIE